MYRIIVSDLDGTLLNNQHMVDPYTADTLRQLALREIPLVIATGRHYVDAVGIRSTLGVPAHLITSNGARVHDPDNQLIYRRDVEPSVVRQLAQPAFADNTVLNFYLDETWLIHQACESLLEMHQDSGFQYEISDLQQHDGQGVAKVLYIGDHDHLTGIEARIQDQFGDRVAVTFSAECCLEVMAPQVSKGAALRMVLGRLGLSADHCLAFGDGQNDVELLQTAGHPRLMANAHSRLTSILPDAERIGNNHESGVARHLRELFNLPE